MEENNLKIQVTNQSQNRITFRLEPWADEEYLNAGEAIVMRAQGPKVGFLEVQYSEEAIIVWGWEGSVIDIEKVERSL